MSKNASFRKILAFGASLTEGFCSGGLSLHPYTLKLNTLLRSISPEVEIINGGVSGEALLSTTMLRRLKQYLSDAERSGAPFDWIFILAGTNDTIRDRQPASAVFERYLQFVERCHVFGGRVLVMTLPETIVPTSDIGDKQRQKFNELLRNQFQHEQDEHRSIFLDLDRLLPRHSLSQEQLNEIWDDGVHLTPKGYDYLAEIIFEKLKTL